MSTPSHSRFREHTLVPIAFRGLLPFSVFSCKEPLTTAGSQPAITCAPEVSHLLDALLPSQPIGLVPSRIRSWGFPTRICSSHHAVRPLERRDLREVTAAFATPLLEVSHTTEVPPSVFGVTRQRLRCPPWVSLTDFARLSRERRLPQWSISPRQLPPAVSRNQTTVSVTDDPTFAVPPVVLFEDSIRMLAATELVTEPAAPSHGVTCLSKFYR
jgi:hypothetical protein